jgi:hypothetical protein
MAGCREINQAKHLSITSSQQIRLRSTICYVNMQLISILIPAFTLATFTLASPTVINATDTANDNVDANAIPLKECTVGANYCVSPSRLQYNIRCIETWSRAGTSSIT